MAALLCGLAAFLLWPAVALGQWQSTGPMAYNGTEWKPLHLELENALQTPPPAVFDVEGNNTIFVAIASFRDGLRCAKTLELLFSLAARPARVFVGLVDQKSNDEARCVTIFCERAPQLCARHAAQVRETVVAAQDSKGPVFARAKQHAMYRDERFCLQIDAHSMFVERWDAELLAEWLATRNEFAVLSTYVHHIERLPINHLHDDVPYICKTKWGEGNMVRNEQASSAIRLPRPKLTFTWGAGFSFSKCHATQLRVRYDPNLPQVFDGEEFSIAMRLFTHGYDVYTPGRNLVFHNYTPVPHHWGHEPAQAAAIYAEKQRSWRRLRTLFRQPEASGEELGEYGLGSCRTYEQFVDYSGVDPRINKESTGAQCGDMQRVPWPPGAPCWPPESAGNENRPVHDRQPTRLREEDEVLWDDDLDADADEPQLAAAAADSKRASKSTRKLQKRLKQLNYLLLLALGVAASLLWCCESPSAAASGRRRRVKDEMLSV